MNTQIQMSLNETGFLKNLNSIFTSSTKVLNELCQNADRANATRVTIELTKEDDQDCLYISDDGCGISDWQKLLTIADSGWTGDVLKSNPYGMGFLSAIFGCTTIEVHSKGKKFTASCDDILNRKPVSIEDTDSFSGTIIIMRGISAELSKYVSRSQRFGLSSNSIHSLGYGYDIEIEVAVYGQSEILKQTHAKCTLDSHGAYEKHSFEYGTIYYLKESLSTSFEAYLQGSSILRYGSGTPVVHLNDDVPARMPDRQNLLEENKVSEVIKTELIFLIEKVLTEKVPTFEKLDDTEKLKFIQIASKYCPHVLNCVDYLDWKIVTKSERMNLSRRQFDSSPEPSIYTRNELENARVIYEMPEYEEETSNANLVYLKMQPDVFFVDSSTLDGDHWIFNLDIQEIQNLVVQASFENLSSIVEFSGHYYFDVATADKYQLTGPFGSVDVVDTALVTEQIETYKSLVVIPSTVMANDAICMYGSYEDEYGELLETEFDVDAIELDVTLTRLRATSTSTLIEHTLQTAFKSESMKALLDAGQYSISITVDGLVTVVNQ
jgi:uncharacterized OsmC-like protein